ncbi:MAG: hypothetical protein ABIT64_02985 [Lysobacteraceae bacterium]
MAIPGNRDGLLLDGSQELRGLVEIPTHNPRQLAQAAAFAILTRLYRLRGGSNPGSFHQGFTPSYHPIETSY